MNNSEIESQQKDQNKQDILLIIVLYLQSLIPPLIVVATGIDYFFSEEEY